MRRKSGASPKALKAISGGIPKRPTGADCKSAGLRLRWFESTSLHQFQEVQESLQRWIRTTERNGGSTDSPGANRNATRKRRGPGGASLRDETSNPPPSTISTGVRCDPPPSANFMQRSLKLRQRSSRCGSSSMVEPQPSKLMVRVRFPSPAPLDCAVDGKLFGKVRHGCPVWLSHG